MSFSHRLLTGTAGAALFTAVSITGAASADAAAPPAAAPTSAAVAVSGEFQCGPNNWIGWLVPENPPGGANFHDACVRHDACYSPGSVTSRKTCDTSFRTRMYRACDNAGLGWTCDRVADLYYGAVRTFGGTYYKGSGTNN